MTSFNHSLRLVILSLTGNQQRTDITVFSTTEKWTVDRNKFYTKGKVSPFDGMTVTGKAKLTVVDGKVVMKEGVVL